MICNMSLEGMWTIVSGFVSGFLIVVYVKYRMNIKTPENDSDPD